MINYKYLLINISVILLVLCPFDYGQGKEYYRNNSLQKNHTPRFQKYNNESKQPKIVLNFYPNNIGDFWEFIATDTTTLLGALYSDLKFSVTREVLNDTLLSNGNSYKTVKWNNEANSVSYPPQFEYQSVDTQGNVYLFYNNTDYILFDFSKQVGETYPAHLANHYWQVTDRYTVIGFGDTLQAIDFVLYEQGSIIKEKYSIAENFGIFFYKKNWDFPFSPGCDNWGAVINGQEYGTLIVKKQTVDWKEFYPLHIGDYWVYEGFNGSFPTVSSVRVIGDTLMPDGNTYFVLRLIDYHFQYTELNYRRLDSLGNIFYWEYLNNEPLKYFKLSSVVGDTLKSHLMNTVFRLNDKYINSYTGLFELNNYLYPDLAYIQNDYDIGLGLYRTTGDLYLSECVGAYVNGNIVWGDTTLTDLEDEINPTISDYKLFQNFPNPFNSSTLISFHLPNSTITELSVYNILGEKIETLINDFLVTGLHTIKFNKSDIPSGVYIYVLKTDEIQLSGKMIYLK
ncbi:MAG: T9SS type A sorting domain-containing protein [Ignavibacteriaceae bacterium]|nr:T9SS type A sorting domain-containing protein [Ignavibacteriaceae bacterium]HRN27447.1 T9SS type A sorting domain-containing protein [Ignavibacteriaceae bacterium]HRQ55137.1 T9SS type A sorting domain-containing protein [Ignavibacteriaceae bacterium]